jgi:ankyrin repeat protein
LLDNGADVNARDVRGMTPLMLAVATDHYSLEKIRMPIAKGADPTVQSGGRDGRRIGPVQLLRPV